MKSISILFCLLFCLASCAEEDTTEMVELVTSSGHRFQIDVYEFPNNAGSEPKYSVDLADAQAACEKKGKRLCTSTEWRRACAGPEGARRYSYGDQYIPRICHTEVDKASGHSSMLDPAGLIVASGAYADCKTDEGIHDLNGNRNGSWTAGEALAECWKEAPSIHTTNTPTARVSTLDNRTIVWWQIQRYPWDFAAVAPKRHPLKKTFPRTQTHESKPPNA